MNLMDGLLLTLLNTVVCIALPKVISVIAAKGESQEPSTPAMESPESSGKIPGIMDAA
ncbi:hypothetical protein [Nodularia sphaerocarpa]|uniref:hypothetical protein n=1 Tax=Nodularia sphaerocarpa TaxID=137816 RepID=UPI001EFC278A|nr:hypothetical protein [Nodularia sphaerocarpa]MDB9372041.1 hypothetical protein [Nodularia sphaerocarpa CS-585]MDB9379230.1 hypothetical protein [Nodularia sphaerocarpa CS-585A2]ULP73605.1 hypothetical protein BDGGKGIB_03262 [Nodularia sphaerocarpa UHCC 0038]